jgi:hypothetical protein
LRREKKKKKTVKGEKKKKKKKKKKFFFSHSTTPLVRFSYRLQIDQEAQARLFIVDALEASQLLEQVVFLRLQPHLVELARHAAVAAVAAAAVRRRFAPQIVALPLLAKRASIRTHLNPHRQASDLSKQH